MLKDQQHGFSDEGNFLQIITIKREAFRAIKDNSVKRVVISLGSLAIILDVLRCGGLE